MKAKLIVPNLVGTGSGYLAGVRSPNRSDGGRFCAKCQKLPTANYWHCDMYGICICRVTHDADFVDN